MPLTPFSPHEQDQIKAAADHSARLAVRRYRREALIGFLILLFGIGGAIYDSNHQSAKSRDNIIQSGDAVAISGCNRDFDTIYNLRQELVSSRNRIDNLVEEGTYTPAQGQRSREGIDRVLESYRLPDCRLADDILTADEPTKKITPRYPGDDKDDSEK